MIRMFAKKALNERQCTGERAEKSYQILLSIQYLTYIIVDFWFILLACQ